MASGKPVIIGSGHTKFGKLDAKSIEDLMLEAADEAMKRHGLAEEPGAPLLRHTTSPADSAGGALTGMIAMPILGFLVWLIGFLVWRAIKPTKAVAQAR